MPDEITEMSYWERALSLRALLRPSLSGEGRIS